MKRRTLLLSTGALALVSMLPRPVAALAPVRPEYHLPIRTLGVIEQALDVAVQCNFTPTERAVLFGLAPLDGGREEVGELRNRVTSHIVEHDALSVWNRTRFLAAIHDRLSPVFSRDSIMWTYFVEDLSLLDGGLRDIMLSGSQMELRRAAHLVGSKVDFHDLDEMLAFD